MADPVDSSDKTSEKTVKSNNPIMAALDGLGNLPWLRQVGLMVGLAASVAIGFGVVLWSTEPEFRPLFTDVSMIEASQVADVLAREKIQFKVDPASGLVMVRAEKINDARMALAKEGLPGGNNMGYELLDKEQGFGTSQFMEKTRYFRSIEGELAKTISSLTPVRNARVHLAIPKRSVFINDKRKPTASVFVELYPSRSLERDQVAAIVHLVASSVPEMSSKDVTVVDQRGRLLSEDTSNGEMTIAARQLDYQHNIEEKYLGRIRDLLEPLLGPERFKVQLTADIDFNVVEQTAESYNPDLPALRSEQTLSEKSSAAGPMGVPGALSNQPPGAASVPEQATGSNNAGNNASSTDAGNQRQQATRNYELDRTISHTRRQVGGIKRLSVAVVLDDKWQNPAADAAPGTQPTRVALSEAELERITLLIKDAVGYDAARGDSVSVINQPFSPVQFDSIPDLPIWQQAWFQDVIRQVAGWLVVIILIFGVLRPILKGLAFQGKEDEVDSSLESALASVGADGSLGDSSFAGADVTFSGSGPNPLLPGPDASFEQHIDAIRALVAEDPRRVAQVVKSWIEAG
ncbi:Flagellar basal-body M-ring protein [gamma proteobacterium HdN1]|nr:Flagellar basal-body M-ring protein [gamma proteobacterium HdN1]